MSDSPERIDFEEDTPRGPQVDEDENDDPGPTDEEVIFTAPAPHRPSQRVSLPS